jgi:hypothetical protein
MDEEEKFVLKFMGGTCGCVILMALAAWVAFIFGIILIVQAFQG